MSLLQFYKISEKFSKVAAVVTLAGGAGLAGWSLFHVAEDINAIDRDTIRLNCVESLEHEALQQPFQRVAINPYSPHVTPQALAGCFNASEEKITRELKAAPLKYLAFAIGISVGFFRLGQTARKNAERYSSPTEPS